MKFDCNKIKSECKACCCGMIPINKKLFEKHKSEVRKIIKEIVEYTDNEIVCFTEDLTCIFLDKNYNCMIYDERPKICRDYGFKEDLYCQYLKPNGYLRTPKERDKVIKDCEKLLQRV